MSDILRTALKGGGEIRISIEVFANRDVKIVTQELYAGLTSWREGTILAEEIDQASDPDGMIRGAADALVRRVYSRYEARRAAALEGQQPELPPSWREDVPS